MPPTADGKIEIWNIPAPDAEMAFEQSSIQRSLSAAGSSLANMELFFTVSDEGCVHEVGSLTSRKISDPIEGDICCFARDSSGHLFGVEHPSYLVRMNRDFTWDRICSLYVRGEHFVNGISDMTFVVCDEQESLCVLLKKEHCEEVIRSDTILRLTDPSSGHLEAFYSFPRDDIVSIAFSPITTDIDLIHFPEVPFYAWSSVEGLLYLHIGHHEPGEAIISTYTLPRDEIIVGNEEEFITGHQADVKKREKKKSMKGRFGSSNDVEDDEEGENSSELEHVTDDDVVVLGNEIRSLCMTPSSHLFGLGKGGIYHMMVNMKKAVKLTPFTTSLRDTFSWGRSFHDEVMYGPPLKPHERYDHKKKKRRGTLNEEDIATRRDSIASEDRVLAKKKQEEEFRTRISDLRQKRVERERKIREAELEERRKNEEDKRRQENERKKKEEEEKRRRAEVLRKKAEQAREEKRKREEAERLKREEEERIEMEKLAVIRKEQEEKMKEEEERRAKRLEAMQKRREEEEKKRAEEEAKKKAEEEEKMKKMAEDEKVRKVREEQDRLRRIAALKKQADDLKAKKRRQQEDIARKRKAEEDKKRISDMEKKKEEDDKRRKAEEEEKKKQYLATNTVKEEPTTPFNELLNPPPPPSPGGFSPIRPRNTNF